jgi:type VII secretion-associated protein (TIGR03931 family)
VTVVEVGPADVRGPNTAPGEWISTAIECLDDEIALLDERPVSVVELWRQIMRAVIADFAATVILVHPSWYSASRTAMLCDAAQAVAARVIPMPRTAVLRRVTDDPIIEFAADFVVVSRHGTDTLVLPRRGPDDADAVITAVGATTAVLFDSPAGSDLLCTTIAERLRVNGIRVTYTAEDTIGHAAEPLQPPVASDAVVTAPARRRGVAVVAGIASVAVICGGFAVRPSDDTSMTLLVEGRMGVMVPTGWHVQRITAGPGSARVQVNSPTDANVAIHLTQARVDDDDLAATADSLRAALEAAPEGVFVDFIAADHRAGRPAVTYRERRPGHQVAWTVLNDGTLRIAIGCQSGADGEQAVRQVCDRVIGSAHAIF